MRKLYRITPLVMIVTVILLQSCSAKKNTAGSRFWQALNTRYNVYYHGKTNYDEQIKLLEDEYQDDYSQRVFVHPAEAKANPKSPQPSGSFDRTIEKMQKAIALHSIKKKPKRAAGKGSDPKYKEWMKREEYNPFLHNAWYLLAKSEYMKGDFLNASATFRYISRHFQWKTELVQESQVWEALCYCALGWTNEADNVLAHVHIDKIENKRIRALANLAFADYYIKDKKNEQAIPYLVQAAHGAKGAQKVRLNFLLGQLYEEVGDKDRAYLAYKKAGSNNSSTYRTKFNARIKQSAVFSGYNVSGEVKALRNMTRFDRNKEYLDQIYYAIGNLYLTRQDTVHAIENYIKAAEKSTRNGVDKAISQIALGGIYFTQHKYDKAQPCYAEAIPQINEDYPNYKVLKHRSDVLDELAVYSQNVTLQDSLLTLSKLPLEEQKKVIKKIIDELKKKEKEEQEAAKREEYMAQQNAQGNPLANKGNQPTQFQMNNDNSWYFYNTATKNAGKTAFQQQWGSRKLEDNWRRRNKATFSLGDDTNDDSQLSANDSTSVSANDTTATAADQEALKRAEDPHYEEYYLKQIPKTEEQIQAAHDIIQEGLYNMGIILKDKLEDPASAEFQFNELMRRYPDNTYRLDAYYNMYLMFMRYNQVGKAEACRDIILTEFAESKYGLAMQDPDYLENLKNMESDQEAMYEQAYSSYLSNNNESVHAAYAEMMRRYPLSKIMPKFMFIDALSYVTQKNYEQFKTTIKDMLQRYPETDITPVASGIVKQLNSGRKLEGGSSNNRGMFWTARLGNDTTGASLDREFTPFKEDLDKPHLFVLLYPTDSVSSNMLLYEVARHNFNSFVIKDYDLEQMTFSRLGLLVVKGFADYAEVEHYRKVFNDDKDMVMPEGIQQVLISDANFQLLLNEGRSFEDYFNYLETRNDSVVEAKVPELKQAQEANDSVAAQAKPIAPATQPATSPKEAKKQDEKDAKPAEKTEKEAKPAGKEAKKNDVQARKDAKEARNEENLKQAQAKREEERKQAEARRLAAEARKRATVVEDKQHKVPTEDVAGNVTSNTESQNVGQSQREEDRQPSTVDRRQQARDRRQRERAEREQQQQSKEEQNDGGNVQNTDASRTENITTTDSTSTHKTVKEMSPEEQKAAKKREQEAKKAAEKARKEAEAAKKKEQEAQRKQQDAERKQRLKELNKQQEKERKAMEAGRKAEEDKFKEEIKREQRDTKNLEKDEQKNLKDIEKQEKARIKAQQKREKQIQDSIKRAEKEADKLLAKLQKAREDSIARAEQAREDSINVADKARLDARKEKEKSKAQLAQEEAQAKIDAKKQAEKDRKERMKDREQERKEKEKARKEKQKEREKARKEKEKQRKQEAKEREKAQKEKAKEREEARKQKQKEREAAQKQREQERKEKAAERKANKK